ncbi:MAG: hypothetical protein H6R10_3563 [Rhodocyclaceae bacterium]|nr:hypothetical protein [Rhodocyclaceae bacterium]
MAETRAPPAREPHVVLEPISHPELGDIAIDGSLFAIGRNEAPFASYDPGPVAVLSRRHARIFSEQGYVYVADLDSKNGTTVNGVAVREKPSRLRDGDELCFGGELSYRVRLATGPEKPTAAARLVSLTLTPERGDLGLQPVVITSFPFLVSKSDEAFARYRDDYPHQVNYLSRRHAHIFQKGATPFIEDLGSTNGTLVSGKRLDEHAVPLREGDVVAFGGHHFVYRVSLQKEAASDPTVTRVSPGTPGGAGDGAEAEKTTFVAAADSFLDIFCVDPAPHQDDEVNDEAPAHADAPGPAGGRKRPRWAVFLSELKEAFIGGAGGIPRRVLAGGAALVAVLGLVAAAAYFRGAPERELKGLLESGDYARAATVASRYLAGHPDGGELKALATEAILRADIPPWLALLKARQYDRAGAALAATRSRAGGSEDLLALVGELEWMGNLERFVGSRGGAEAPIRIYRDEDGIKALLQGWNDDPPRHQRAFETISSLVPDFRDPYAEALSHLRKLQSDDAVYLAAIERLKGAIATELNQDRPQALEAILQEYGEKYPRLGGLDSVREDLRRYLRIDAEMRARRLDRLVPLLAGARFSTPPFAARFQALAASGRLPPADVLRQYETVDQAWRDGRTDQAFAGLQQLAAGPWKDMAERELARRKAIVDGFAQLQKAQGGQGYDERLLAFYTDLDPDRDVYFLQATETGLGAGRDKVLGWGQGLTNRAQALWTQYRESGGIAGEQQAESAVSPRFRGQARLLAESRDSLQRSRRIYARQKVDIPPTWTKLQNEIEAEAESQRRSLQELRNTLEPAVLKAKLALIGERSDEQGQSP